MKTAVQREHCLTTRRERRISRRYVLSLWIVGRLKSADEKKRVIIEGDERSVSRNALVNVEFILRMESFAARYYNTTC